MTKRREGYPSIRTIQSFVNKLRKKFDQDACVDISVWNYEFRAEEPERVKFSVYVAGFNSESFDSWAETKNYINNLLTQEK